VLTTPERATRVAKRIIGESAREVARLYREETRAAGYLETRDRQGSLTRYPLMTVSVGGVSTAHRPVSSYLELTEIAAEMKVCAKTQDGGNFVIDRRRN
jgi:hypothetical protein